VYKKQLDRSEKMAKHALVEKTILLLAHDRKAEAMETIRRLKGMSGSDPLITAKVQALEKQASKG
jgi:hypothetical protein